MGEVRGLCPRHPHKPARGRCVDCRQLFCARCEFRTDHRLFCGPACAREHQRRRGEHRTSRRFSRAPIAAILIGMGIAVAPVFLRMSPSRLPPAPGRALYGLVPSVPAPRVAVPASFPPPLERRPLPNEKSILVSFDAGSSDRGAEEILDALRERRIRTTIFLTGQFIRRFPELTRRIGKDGHEVGNHTFDHPHLTTYADDGRQRTRAGVTEEMLRRELESTASLYRATTGRAMAALWRAPFGEENEEIRGWAARAGYAHVSWTHGSGSNLDALDWVSDPESPRYRTSERVISRLLASARPGNIILMHLGSDREDPVAGHLPRLLDALSSQGYRFSTASDLLASGDTPR